MALISGLLFTLLCCTSVLAGLNKYITNHHLLNYDTEELKTLHSLKKRSIYSKPLELNVTAFGRPYTLVLNVAYDSIFHGAAVLELDGKETDLNVQHLVEGYVEGDPESKITGSIINGIFQGQIKTSDGEHFYVEKAEYYKEFLPKGKKAHSVIYRHSDVNLKKFHDERRGKRSAAGTDGHSAFCGVSETSIAQWMHHLQQSAQEDSKVSYARKKRATAMKTCNLFIQTDPELWDYIKSTHSNGVPDSLLVDEITSLIQDFIIEVNDIYKTTTFGGGNSGYNFRIDRVAVNRTCQSTNDHWFCNRNLDVSNFLNLNTYRNHDDYCLAYVFTYRDFDGGTLGLAWVAEPQSTHGGICSKYKTYLESGGTRKKSLNTGIVTLKNYGERVPKLMSQLTVAHEIGHNFGSPHDEENKDPSCAPYTDNKAEDGNYIMYYAAIEGNRPNHYKFSSCSKAKIGAVLSADVNTVCLIDGESAWCGNSIKEEGEECDCGYASDCLVTDCCKCCIGRGDPSSDQACTRRGQASCDPSEGPCCSSSCTASGNMALCRAESECALQASCDGSSVACPASQAKPDDTLCNSKTQVCAGGQCNKTVCSLIGWESCDLASSDGVTAEALCYVSCKNPSTGKCESSYDTTSIGSQFQSLLRNHNSGNKIPLPPGQPCDQDQGFCDYFQSCRKIDALGPLARLKGLLKSFTSAEGIAKWLKEYWWVVLLSVLGVVLLMALLVKFCAVFTPSSNPEKRKNRKFSTPLTKGDKRSMNDAGRYRPSSSKIAGPLIGGRGNDIEMR